MKRLFTCFRDLFALLFVIGSVDALSTGDGSGIGVMLFAGTAAIITHHITNACSKENTK